MKLKTTYKYIFKELFPPFFIGAMVFTFILIMFQVLRLAEFMVVHGVSFFTVLKLTFFLVLAFLPITVPISFLFSVLIVFSRMSSDSEIVAFKASGISIFKLMKPVLAFSFVVSLITLYVSFHGGPWGNRTFENYVHKIGSKKAAVNLKEGFFNYELGNNFVVYSKKIDSENNVMNDVFIYDGRDQEMPVVITAKNSKIDINDLNSQTIMFLYDGYINFLVDEPTKYRRAKFNKYSIKLFEGKNIQDRSPNPPSMFYSEIKSIINKTRNKKTKNSMKVELNRRFAIPFACILFAVLGVVFGNFNTRSVKAGAGVFSFIIMVLYWIIYVAGTSLGVKGYINPILSVWFANIIFMLFSSYLLYKSNY